MDFKCNYIIIIFIITAVWDVILRFVAEGKINFFGLENTKWVISLRGYFKKHTVLGAALIAGFVGAITYVTVYYLANYFEIDPNDTLQFGSFIVLISGIIGIPMRYSGLFPHLKKYYYDKLGLAYSFLTDALSGLVVIVTLALVLKGYNYANMIKT